MRHSQEGLDVEVVCGENDLKQHLLVDSDKLLIPFTDVCRALACLVLGLVRVCAGKRLPAVMFAVLQDLTESVVSQAQWRPHKGSTDLGNTHLLEDARRYVGQRDRLIALANVYHQREWLETYFVGDKEGLYLQACFL